VGGHVVLIAYADTEEQTTLARQIIGASMPEAELEAPIGNRSAALTER